VNLATLAADSAQRAGGNLAVAGPDGSLTYTELDRAADLLAASLQELGIARGDRVVIWLAKSVSTVVAMQAVLRLAAVYVPLDEVSPAARAQRIARDCAAVLIITDARHAAELDGSSLIHVLSEPPATDGAVTKMMAAVSPDDLAYILYTSGSTGAPKGVCITHGNALAFIQWAAREIGAASDDRFANHAPFGFDLSVFDIYVAFLAGASVHLIPAVLSYAPRQLVDFVCSEQITVWYSVPSVLVLMISKGGLCGTLPPSLRALLFAGEPFPVEHLSRLYRSLPGVRFLNLYGPTETNVCTFHAVTDLDVSNGRPLPIGRACSGDEVWAETDDGKRARSGEDGELLVRGPTVMKGYWGRPAHHGPYRTGDLVRVREDGGFDFIGRRDHMVKVRGYRIEPGEIEKALQEHPRVAEAAVVVSKADGGDVRLVAFVVPSGDEPPGLLSVKRHCASRLPLYMVVDSVVVLPELPRTHNGKTDRRLLSATVQGHPRKESDAI